MIEVRHLKKAFGRVRAVADVSFTVGSGEVFGLLGPNGAGKTTTLRLLATLLTPDGGEATVGGYDIRTQAEQVRATIGVVNGGMGLYERLSGREVLHYFGKLYRLNRSQVEARIAALDALLELGNALDRRCGEYSTGMKQKLVIARAVIHDPPILFFDEATAGLDVMARRAVLDFVKRYPSERRTVIYSTHVMSEVEELCRRVAILYQGKLVALDDVAALKARFGASTLEQAFFALVASQGVRA